MTPTTELAPLPKLFASFGDFMLGTFTMKQAADFCRNNPGHVYEGVAQRDPNTGKLVSRWHVRKASVVPTTTPAGPQAPVAQSPKPKKIKEAGETRNGITSPSSTSVGAKIWKLCDELFSIRKDAFTKSLLLAESTNRGFNHGNALTECSRWRKFHGMTWKL